jgi:hypothetical protein
MNGYSFFFVGLQDLDEGRVQLKEFIEVGR